MRCSLLYFKNITLTVYGKDLCDLREKVIVVVERCWGPELSGNEGK